MTDDIVTRLRTWESEFDLHWTLPNEAADEIERLRSELAEARNGLTWIVKIPNRLLEQDND